MNSQAGGCLIVTAVFFFLSSLHITAGSGTFSAFYGAAKYKTVTIIFMFNKPAAVKVPPPVYFTIQKNSRQSIKAINAVRAAVPIFLESAIKKKGAALS